MLRSPILTAKPESCFLSGPRHVSTSTANLMSQSVAVYRKPQQPMAGPAFQPTFGSLHCAMAKTVCVAGCQQLLPVPLPKNKCYLRLRNGVDDIA